MTSPVTKLLAQQTRAPSPTITARTPRRLRVRALALTFTAGVLLATLLSISVGAQLLAPQDVLAGLIGQANEATNATVWHGRLPRAILALVLGAALASAGALMQTLTRNPLASPQTFGVNAGAALMTVIAIVYSPWPSALTGPTPALLGAAIAAAAVIGLSIRANLNPTYLALAGICLHLLGTALVQAITVTHDAAVDVVFWTNGSIAGAQWSDVLLATVLIGPALTIAICTGRSLYLLCFGEALATSLGRNYRRSVLAAALLVAVLAGASVAIAGPIGFLGLIVPPIVRALAGRQPEWELPLAALMGALVLSLADAGSRLVLWPGEMPVGILTALMGAPLFLVLIRRNFRACST